MITKEDFNSWKDNPVTIAFFESVEGMHETYVEQIIQDLQNERTDFCRGIIHALRGVLKTDLEDME